MIAGGRVGKEKCERDDADRDEDDVQHGLTSRRSHFQKEEMVARMLVVQPMVDARKRRP
jgi:hypothetical protein